MTGRRALLSAAAVSMASLRVVQAQLAAKELLIGVLGLNPPAPQSTTWNAFVDELRQRGHVEGQNLQFERRHSGDDTARLVALAAELGRPAWDLDFTATFRGSLLLPYRAKLKGRKLKGSVPFEIRRVASPLKFGEVAGPSANRKMSWPPRRLAVLHQSDEMAAAGIGSLLVIPANMPVAERASRHLTKQSLCV